MNRRRFFGSLAAVCAAPVVAERIPAVAPSGPAAMLATDWNIRSQHRLDRADSLLREWARQGCAFRESHEQFIRAIGALRETRAKCDRTASRRSIPSRRRTAEYAP